MRPWHYARIKFKAPYPYQDRPIPFQAPAGNWVFFYIHYRHNAKLSPFRQSFVTMHTLGLDGVP